jgi:hypothetical protein
MACEGHSIQFEVSHLYSLFLYAGAVSSPLHLPILFTTILKANLIPYVGLLVVPASDSILPL